MQLSKSSRLYNYLRPFNGQNEWTSTFTNNPTDTCNLALKIIGVTLAYNTIAWTLATLIIFFTNDYHLTPVSMYLPLPSMYIIASMTAGFIMSFMILFVGVGVIIVLAMLICILVIFWAMSYLAEPTKKIIKAINYKPKSESKFCKPIDIVD